MTKLTASILGAFVAASIAFPASAQQHYQGNICGNKVDVDLTPPGADADPALKQYFGVWGNGKWSTGICNGLVVSGIKGNRATITYYYGSGPDVPKAGSFVKTNAAMKGKYLFFKSEKGFDVSYELIGGELRGWFANAKLTKKLQKMP